MQGLRFHSSGYICIEDLISYRAVAFVDFLMPQFARLEDAKAAQNLNGQLEIAGRVIKVYCWGRKERKLTLMLILCLIYFMQKNNFILFND